MMSKISPPSSRWAAIMSAPKAPVVSAGLDAATALIRLSHVVQFLQTRVADEHDLTPTQARLLCILAGRSQTMSELARGSGLRRLRSPDWSTEPSAAGWCNARPCPAIGVPRR